MALEQHDVQALRAALRDAVEERRPDHIRETLDRLPADDAVDLLLELSPIDLAHVVTLMGDDELADLLKNVPAATAARLVLKLSRGQAADVLEEMDPDDATDVVEALDRDQAEAILVEMEPAEAREIRQLMTYPPDSAGGRMTPEFVALSPSLTVDQALTKVRQAAEEAETVYYAYGVDGAGHLLGVLNLRDLVTARPGTPVSQVMVTDPVKVQAEADQEYAARLLSEHRFLALPVVDAENRLLGIITADDAAEIIEQESSEDFEHLGGSSPLEQPYITAGPFTLTRKRVGWLLLLFVAEAYTGSVLRLFENELQRVVALAFFIPLLIGTGGNTGSQIVTTIIRAMAVGEVDFKDLLRVWLKEISAGLLLGAIMAAATFIRAWTLSVSPEIGLTVAITAAAIVLWSATVSALLPFVLRRFGVDPALVSAPFITTVVDGTGLVIYFEIARYLLKL